jgi:predicted MFS family arabinose efflux permease
MPASPSGPSTGSAAGTSAADRLTRTAKIAVSVVFATNGLALASWLARVPEIQELLALSPGQLGLLLLCLSVGAISALPLAGVVVRHLGPARTVAVGGLAAGAAVVLAGVGAQALALAAVTGAALLVIGAASGCWDVAMNVEAAAVEQRLGRTVMPRFHAAFSLGTVVGAVGGFAASAAAVPVAVHLGAVGAVVAVVTLLASRRFLPVDVEAGSAAEEHGSVLLAWREKRTLLLGLLVLCAAFTEGVANDWLAVGLRDGYDVSGTVGVLGFALFVTAMTAGRLVGGPALDRIGRVPVLVASFALVIVGVLVVVFSPVLWLAMVGALVWGLGASIGFPLGISAAADGGNAEARVSVVATIGYTAFLAGPPLLGFLGDRIGVHPALLVVAVVSVPGLLLARAARRPAEPAPAEVAAGARAAA